LFWGWAALSCAIPSMGRNARSCIATSLAPP
jgi:hypothetical protein